MHIAKRLTTAIALTLGMAAAAHAEETPSFQIAWTIYAGSMPLGYAEQVGILDKWADRYGIDIQAVQLNDYIEAQNQYTAGQFDGVIAIALDALTIPAAIGVDSTVVMPLSASAGSDGIVMKGKDKSVEDLKGARINLMEFSGSHYLLVRALDQHGMSERDLSLVNTSDADIITAFQSSDSDAVATWKPQLSVILEQNPDSTLIFDSVDIPNEITDVLLVHTDTLEEHPELGYALAGAWYEVMSRLQAEYPDRDEVMAFMADAVGTDPAGFQKQIDTIHFFTPEEATQLVTSQDFADTIESITQFAWDKGLLGQGATGPDAVGVQFGEAHVLGNEQNVNLRFPTSYMERYTQ